MVKLKKLKKGLDTVPDLELKTEMTERIFRTRAQQVGIMIENIVLKLTKDFPG